jgi:hypothetical protein
MYIQNEQTASMGPILSIKTDKCTGRAHVLVLGTRLRGLKTDPTQIKKRKATVDRRNAS